MKKTQLLLLLGEAAALSLFAQNLSAATFNVNTLNDTSDVNTADGLCQDSFGNCSLRAAVQQANSTAVADTIYLAAGTHCVGSYIGITADLTIKKNMLMASTVDGGNRSGSACAASGVDIFRTTGANVDLTLNGFSLKGGANSAVRALSGGGTLTFRSMDVSQNSSPIYGGAAYFAGTTFTSTSSTFSQNQASSLTRDTAGGAIYLTKSATTLNITSSTFSNNVVSSSASQALGGAVFASEVDATISGSEFSQNMATSVGYVGNAMGGGLYLGALSTINISDGAISGNSILGSTTKGSGLYVAGDGNLKITAVDIDGNTTQGGSSFGAGIFVTGTTTSIADSNINFNESLSVSSASLCASSGGGIYHDSILTLETSNVLENIAQTLMGTACGAGVFIADSKENSFLMKNSAVAKNIIDGEVGGYGGGLFVATSSDMANHYIENSTISNNSADNGGGIYFQGSNIILGTDGLMHQSVATSFWNVTLAENDASNGGGVYNDNYYFTTAGTSTANVSIVNTILAENTASTVNPQCVGPMTGVRSNLLSADYISAGCGYILSGSDLVVLLGGSGITALADHGGLTLTHGLDGQTTAVDGDPISPAIDHGTTCVDHLGVALTTDQREYLRPVDGDGNGSALCDIGAFEYQGISDNDNQ